jgi:hypothetical protein
MTERERLLLRIILSYALSNLDDVRDSFQVAEEGECPNCKCGTLAFEGGRIVCRGECGQDFGEEGSQIDYNGEIVEAPTEEEVERLRMTFQ